MIKLTAAEHSFLRAYTPGHSYAEIRDAFKSRFGWLPESKNFPKNYIHNHKLNTGKTGRFKKGHIPANRGKRVSKDTYEKCKGTMFKQGNLPPSTDPIGTEKRLWDGYTWVKVNNIPNAKKSVNWKQKHRLVYEQHYGAVPKNHIVIFLDGDKENFNPENLVAITRGELAILNRCGLVFKYPDLTRAGISVAKLLSKISKAKKRREDAGK